MLTVHGRTRADRFNGEAEYETIAQIVDAVSIPVVANGDIDSAHKTNQVLRQTGAEGVMIGRAAQGQLWLPGAIAAALAAGLTSHTAPSVTRQLDIQRRHLTALHAFHGAHLGHRIARKHFAWFLESLAQQEHLTTDQARWCRRRFNEITTPQAQLSLFDELADDTALCATQHGHRKSNESKLGARLAA
jgi:tRNA-dihydrouridine synthase B